MNFVISLPILINWKSKTYNSILIIVDCLTKIIYYKLVKIIINAPSLAKIMIYIIIYHHNFLDSIVNNQKLVFTSKFLFFFTTFLVISAAFLLPTNCKLIIRLSNKIIQ